MGGFGTAPFGMATSPAFAGFGTTPGVFAAPFGTTAGPVGAGVRSLGDPRSREFIPCFLLTDYS